MWTLDTEYNKWYRQTDSLTKENYDYLKQTLDSVRFYSKCLSGATYYPVNDLDNIYDILGSYVPRNWYVSSPYSITSIPTINPRAISATTSTEYFDKYSKEYGLTLKNLFTPKRLIDDSLNNFIYVDVCSTEEIQNIADKKVGLVIDGVTLKEGHRILIKDQRTNVTLSNLIDADSYFYPTNYYEALNQAIGSVDTDYYYYNEFNGIYIYKNSKLVKETDLDVYADCIRYSICVKLGTTNKDKQFHLTRMRNGYYPTTSENLPIDFKEKHNWIIRNRVDYNNVLDLNYYDILKHSTQTYYDSVLGFTYSIPERLIAVGEFGSIINYQDGIEHIINNKYKVNIRSIVEVNGYYWVCGDEGTILKVSKIDFSIQKSSINILSSLTSISFFNDLRGVVVGDFNIIYYTNDGGYNWIPITVDDFSGYSYNKVIYYSIDKFYVVGDSGIFLEFILTGGDWTINKKRVAKYIDDDDEYILVEDINSIVSFTSSNWGLFYAAGSGITSSIPSYKEGLMLVTSNNNFIIYNLNGFVDYDFLYLDFESYNYDNYGDINSVTWKSDTNEFYFAGQEIYSFDINNFQTIGSSVSNIIYGATGATLSQDVYANSIKDYNQSILLVAGNNSLFDYATYSYLIDEVLDSTFSVRLKSKLLFLDYDIASKLNFFDDQQNYRLPNSATSSSYSIPTYINLKPLSGETNWLTYWSDRLKTFEYYSNSPLSDSSKVEMSFTFSYSASTTINSFTSSDVTISYNDVFNLAPHIGDSSTFGPGVTNSSPQSSRYNGYGLTAISIPSATYSLYLYDYLMVYRVNSVNNINVGDVVRLESDLVSDNFIINRIFATGSNKYCYAYTDFNEAILNDIKSSTYSITVTNLNQYSITSELENRFNLHPISNAYELSYSTASVSGTSSILDNIQIDSKFNYLTSYYNLASEVDFSGTTFSMSYEDTFLKFGYKPTYEILSYLENINSTLFSPGKEFLAMPIYYFIPGVDNQYYVGFSGLTAGNIYIDTNSYTNKLVFGEDLKLEWESLLKYTYVDVSLSAWSNILTSTGSTTFTTDKLLIINKYQTDSYLGDGQKAYIIEFHKKLNYDLYYDIEFVSIISRRFLSQISSDLQEISNIQRPKSSVKEIATGYTYSNYESELNFKFPTDSYAKILLSDSDVIDNLSGIIYTDYKNELALNITKLDKEIEVNIQTTTNFATGSNNYLYISCSDKHGLKEGDGVILEFTGATGSSQQLNPQYFGFNTIGTFPGDEYNFFVYKQFGTPTLIGSDPGLVKYIRQDPFFNYQPVDLIDLGVDRKTKISINLQPENVDLVGSTHKLVDVDYTKYKFKLLDGLTLDIITTLYPWLLEAEISDAIIGMDTSMNLIWYTGIWHCGRWFGSSNGKVATWVSGIWVSGDWYGGIWKSNTIVDKLITIDVQKISNTTSSIWYDGRWYDGTWENGTWQNGRWYGGIWNSGNWFNGIWNDGTWLDGNFTGGVWVLGNWKNGIFNTNNKPAYWLDGTWDGGDFENGIWYNGVWDQKNKKISRFGVKSFNSRTSTWHAGKWVTGEFHSRLNLNDQGLPDVSSVHKLSIWRTGIWSSGNWYGGIAYNINFRSGTWHGGILEDIQICGVDTTDNTFQLNGIFKFNIGDTIKVIDNQYGGSFSVYGSNDIPTTYKVLYQTEDDAGEFSTIYIDRNLVGTYSITEKDLNLRVVSYYEGSNWKSGIWMNGMFNNGLWDGGIWYNGVFNGTWG